MEPGLSSWVDFFIIGIYFCVVTIVSILSMFRKSRESVQGYFLAGRSIHWIPIGASIFASNIGTEHFLGLSGSGAASGIAVVTFEWGAVFLLLLLGWVFLPIYLKSQVFTMPEYLGRRFGGYRMRIYLTIVALSLNIVTKISVDVYAGGVFLQQATGWDLYVSMVPLLILAAIYTIIGGLAGVVFTDAIQTVIMLIGAIVLSIMAFVKVGGMEGLYTKYMQAIPANVTTNSTCGLPLADAFHIFRDPVKSGLPWPGVIIRATLASLWYWCSDQVIVQRTLAARNMAQAQASTLLAGLLKITPLFLIILPGMISRVLYPDEVACSDPDICKSVCNNPSGCSNIAYPLLILNMAPIGVRGLLIAVMIAALITSLTSVFNSAATVFTMDIWRKVKPKASERHLLIVGRIFVFLMVLLSVAWIPLIIGYHEGQLYIYIQAVTGYIAPPICSIFLLAVFVPRINETGAFWGMLAGHVTGITRLVLDFTYRAPRCGHEDTRPAIVADLNFTYFSGIVLTISALVAILVSFAKPAQPRESIENLIWWGLKGRKTSTRDFISRSDDVNIESDETVQKGEGVNLKTRVDAQKQMEMSTDNLEIKVFDSFVPSPWRHVLNLSAFLLIGLMCFLFGFFA